MAVYVSTHYGMMGNNYYYSVGEDSYNLAIATLGTSETLVIRNGEQIAIYTDKERIMPEEAFRRLGIETDVKRPIEIWECFGTPLESLKWDVK